MASASSSTPFFGAREDKHHIQVMQQQSSSAPAPQTAAAPVKKKRNLPGNPYPDAEVIALSPRTLLATNRFICEVCNKGFKREQNLQLHRRGHNLPWKLRQKTTKEVRRRVYLCPEPTCVHHDPSRALGDLTGVKKHFCRKHGEKKWKCEKCSKRYAVQSDWKAHSKICGTREYRCNCGTLFSRRDSFITHRAFCDALGQESARLPTSLNTLGSHIYGSNNNNDMVLGFSQVNSQISSLHNQRIRPSTDLLHLTGDKKPLPLSAPQPTPLPSSAFYLGGGSINKTSNEESLLQSKTFQSLMQQLPDLQSNTTASSSATAANTTTLFNLSFFSNNGGECSGTTAINKNDHPTITDPLFARNEHMGYNCLIKDEPVVLPQQLSATALLQKAAQIGATNGGGSSLLGGFSSSASPGNAADFSASFSGSHGSSAGDGFRSQMDQNETEHHMQYLMNSLASGGINGLFGSSTGVAAVAGATGGRHGEENAGFGRTFMSGSLCNTDETKYINHSSTGLNLGVGLDMHTRDFLGVGSMVRSMGGGIFHREHHHGIDHMSSLDGSLQ